MITSGAVRVCRAAAVLSAVALFVALGGQRVQAAGAPPRTTEPDVSAIASPALRDAALLAAPSIVGIDAEISGRLRDDGGGSDYTYDLGFGGTGFFASSDGYIVTAAHVAAPTDEQVHTDFVDERIDDIEHCVRTTTDSCRSVELRDEPALLQRTSVDNVRITLHVQTQDMSADEVGLSARLVAGSASGQKDVAVLKVDAQDAPVLLLAQWLASVDTPVAVEGYPESKQEAADPLIPTVTSGRVTDTRAGDEGFAAAATVVETDARIEHGNSGGPGVDPNGDVVGIVSYGPSVGVSYLISAGDVAGVLASTAAKNQLGRADTLWRGGLTAQSQGDTSTARNDYARCEALGAVEVGCSSRLAELNGGDSRGAGPGAASSSVPDLTGAQAAEWLGAGVGIGIAIGVAITLLVVRVMPRRPDPSPPVQVGWEWRWGPNGWTLQPRSYPQQPGAWGGPVTNPWDAGEGPTQQPPP